jgi:hypothetical protein
VNALSPLAAPRPVAIPNDPTSQAAAPAAEGHSLLPSPGEGALGATDPLSFLYLLESQDGQMSMRAGTDRVRTLQDERQQALKKEQEAIQKAIEAEHNHNFWDDLGGLLGDVAKIAGIVASVAAAATMTVASCGLTAPAVLAIAAAVLSAASFTDSKLHVLRSLGADPKVEAGLDVGLEVGGLVTSFGAGAIGTVKETATVAGWVEGGASVAEAAADVGSGVATLERGQADATAANAAADEVMAEALSEHAARMIQAAIDDTQSADERTAHALRTIAGAKTIEDATTTAAANAVRG